jgi:putative ABC transport system substrate-binding protein
MSLARAALVGIVASGILSAALAGDAQPPAKVRRIGFLAVQSSARVEAFWQGLRELGYVEGQNVTIERRLAEGKLDRLPGLAADLVRLKVDVIVALDPPSTNAAKNATKRIPIVMRSSSDPVEQGLVASIPRPGGNLTGVYSLADELVGKRLELLKETIPRASRVAVLWNPDWTGSRRWFREADEAGRLLGVQLQSVATRVPGDFATALEVARKGHAGGLITLRSPLIVSYQRRIVDLAARNHLPAIYDDREFAASGGLMSYGTNLADLYRRAAIYVDKILKGAQPADLPVEQPTRFELVINLKTAKALGLTIPPSVLFRADQVIQ